MINTVSFLTIWFVSPFQRPDDSRWLRDAAGLANISLSINISVQVKAKNLYYGSLKSSVMLDAQNFHSPFHKQFYVLAENIQSIHAPKKNSVLRTHYFS